MYNRILTVDVISELVIEAHLVSKLARHCFPWNRLHVGRGVATHRGVASWGAHYLENEPFIGWRLHQVCATVEHDRRYLTHDTAIYLKINHHGDVERPNSVQFHCSEAKAQASKKFENKISIFPLEEVINLRYADRYWSYLSTRVDMDPWQRRCVGLYC